MEKKAVLFNFWGIVVPSTPKSVFNKLEELHNFGGVLSDVASQKDGAMMRAEKGGLILTQMIPEFEAECVKEAQTRDVKLPPNWSAQAMLEEFRKEMLDVRDVVIKMAARLQQNGVLTAVLANQWIDDSASRDDTAHLLCQLGQHFNLVLQSCYAGHRVPEPAMFSSALQQLGVLSHQALWLDVDEEGVKAAKAAGMKAILMTNLEDALEKISNFTKVQVVGAESPPPSCSPNEVSHGYISIKPGVKTHYVEMGTGPPVLFCHGFPESWYSWRFQLPAVAAAGFRALALDMKGYGESTAPADFKEYSMDQLCKGLITFLDKMAIPQVTLVGHDWGGALVWSMARYFPERIRAVASLNTPLFPVDPTGSRTKKLLELPTFDYQIYFQKPGVAEAELEKDLERTVKIFFYKYSEKEGRPNLNTAGVCARGGLFVGLPQKIPRSSMLTEMDLQYYVSQFKKSGFRGPLNWYRNSDISWKWMCSLPSGKILMPALMVTAENDPILLPSFSKRMEDLIPNLSRGHIENCGHWTQMDKPAETNKILISWLKNNVHKKDGEVTMATKK
ncbi:bifunctional epoxide hydrolase 2 [Austrofundulus limnaeus]|uniref:Bifunctional epoxide hydrolase 2 n=1 Tax=Austrofundulus limnaeus TaxID=52670 RepID=A0A2I4CB77_AUSLI|nr:PREDICTED: bifunctional epoxide hydrolase 2 [Austrofundulus limnaeus]